jgi:general secretion pathway protein N
MIGSLRGFERCLLGLAAALAVLIAALFSGVGHSPHWLPERSPPTLPGDQRSVTQAPEASLQSLANTWQAPLFSTDRSPDQSTAQAQAPASSLAGLTLTGVVINGDLHVALLKQAEGPALKVNEGQQLPNGWTLQRLAPTQARFTLDGRKEVLRLPAPRLPAPSNTPPISLSHDSAP